jgi:hypothetical protein
VRSGGRVEIPATNPRRASGAHGGSGGDARFPGAAVRLALRRRGRAAGPRRFGERIRRLLGEEDPFLPDFDGARLARERDYRARSLDEGLAAFRAGREANLALLRSLGPDQWTRAGTQEGVGRVALCDLPSMMAEHDAAHRAEIEAWDQARG